MPLPPPPPPQAQPSTVSQEKKGYISSCLITYNFNNCVSLYRTEEKGFNQKLNHLAMHSSGVLYHEEKVSTWTQVKQNVWLLNKNMHKTLRMIM